MLRYGLYCFVLFLSLSQISLSASAVERLACAATFQTFLTNNSELSLSRKINSWQGLKEKCRPAGYYYYRLSKFYLAASDLDNAKTSQQQGLKLGDDAYEYNELMGLEIEFSEISSKTLDDKGWPVLETTIQKYIDKHPDLGDAYALMSSVNLARRDYAAAVSNAEKAADLEGDISPALGRTLTIAYTWTKQYTKAINTGNNASAMADDLIADKYFMLALMRAYVGNNEVDKAMSTFNLLITTTPGVKSDADVQRYSRILKRLLRGSGK